MARRVSLPAADDLFRPTGEATVRAVPDQPETDPEPAEPHTPSGRIRHDEKMTVYVTSDELLEIEHARLSLRRSQGLAVDRGRLVRTAISMVLADLEANGDDSALVRRLKE
ncbi:MAG: hypothetical protein WKF79_15500 [Nocardioides sp.]